jgi:flagellar biosynthesis protein FliP
MTATYATAATTAPRGVTSIGSLLGGGLVATVAASAATPVVAAAGRALGISVDVEGAPIPVLGFATLTGLFSLVGLVLAVVLARTAGRPRRVWVRTTVVLTVLSFAPDLIFPMAPATRVLLVLTHVVAAAIVIPAVARRLAA